MRSLVIISRVVSTSHNNHSQRHSYWNYHHIIIIIISSPSPSPSYTKCNLLIKFFAINCIIKYMKQQRSVCTPSQFLCSIGTLLKFIVRIFYIVQFRYNSWKQRIFMKSFFKTLLNKKFKILYFEILTLFIYLTIKIK